MKTVPTPATRKMTMMMVSLSDSLTAVGRRDTEGGREGDRAGARRVNGTRSHAAEVTSVGREKRKGGTETLQGKGRGGGGGRERRKKERV